VIPLLATLLSTSHADAEVSFKTHTQSIVGQTIQVKVMVSNLDAEPLKFPDLGKRPWLVRFETTDPDGARRQLYSTPPPKDTDALWAIAPGERRAVLFDIPSSDTWAVGRATATVIVNDMLIGSQTVDIIELNPLHTDSQAKPVDQTKGPLAALYATKNTGTTGIWLGRSGRTDFLLSVPGTVKPELSMARADRHIGRWITWLDSKGTLWGFQTHLRDVQTKPFPINFPWPKAVPCGRSATDANARLVIPLCIDSPDGKFTQLAAAIVTGKKPPLIRPIARFRPSTVLTNVDAGGNVDFILIRPHAVDIATIEADENHSRPSTIDRLWRGSETIEDSALAMSPTGPAIQIKLMTEETLVIDLAKQNRNDDHP